MGFLLLNCLCINICQAMHDSPELGKACIYQRAVMDGKAVTVTALLKPSMEMLKNVECTAFIAFS